MPFALNPFYLSQPTKAFLYLMRHLGYTQREAQRLIARGRLFVAGVPMIDPAAVIEGAIEVVEFMPYSRGLEPSYIYDDFAAFDKPSGMLVHPSSMSTPYSLIDEAKHHFGSKANIVHRIDQETSGLVLVSKHREAEVTLKTAFESREISKEYLALVKGHVKESLCIDAPIDRYHNQDAVVKIMMEIHPQGKPSQTQITPLHYYERHDMTLVCAKPRTGRQHQIRLHLFHVEHPIVGDPLYNVPIEIASDFLNRTLDPTLRLYHSGAPRLMLHAHRLTFNFKNTPYDIISRVDFKEVCEAFLSTLQPQ